MFSSSGPSIDTSGTPKARHTKRAEKMKFRKDMDFFKQTLITFDKGAIWQPIEAPMKDSNGNKIICMNDNCKLHLNSISNMHFGPIYSPKNALGILVSSGNVGNYLA